MTPVKQLLGLALLSALAMACAPAQAQTPIRIDVPVTGQLDADSPKADDGTPYQLYVYEGRPGERVRVRMDSDAFDAFLAVGTVAAPGCSDDCRMDDDGGDGLNASLMYVVPASGRLQIRANSITPDDRGSFSLSVSRLPPLAAPVTRAARVGGSETARFTDTTSIREDDDVPYDLWTLQGRPGQALVVRMDSDDFDAFLQAGQMQGGRFVVEAQDDDGGDGLNARLRVPLDGNGRGLVRATAFSGQVRGSYRLSVAEPPQPRPITITDIGIGESVRGRLDDNDPFTGDDDVRFDVYRINGSPGQRVVVRMESADFDPLLRWGIFDGEQFIEDQFDDDSGGGHSAQFTVTLDAAGEGRVVATAWQASEGAYILSVVAAPRAARP